MFGAADTLITLLIFAAVALLTQWLQRKQQKEAESPESEQPQGPPVIRPPSAPPPKPADWEEELRRLLEGEKPRPQPAPPPAKPVPGRPSPRPRVQRGPPPLPKAAPKPAGPPPVEAAAAVVPSLPETVAPALPSKAEERARELERQVAEYLRTFAQPEPAERPGAAPAPMTVQAPEVVRSVAAPELAQAHARVRSAPVPEAERIKAMLRDRTSARSVFLAGVILGPPKALQGLDRPEILS